MSRNAISQQTTSRPCSLLLLALLCLGPCARATSIFLNGVVTQDLNDSGETAVNNPALNNINDGDSFTVTLTFNGSLSGPSSTPLTSVAFEDTTVSAGENSFISGTMVITLSAGYDQFAVLGCLLDSVSCTEGNELDLNFQIPTTGLNGSGVTASLIPGLTPSLDLLEDYADTEIQGSITSYTYQASSGPTDPAPEPSTLTLLILAAAALAVRTRIHHKKIN